MVNFSQRLKIVFCLSFVITLFCGCQQLKDNSLTNQEAGALGSSQLINKISNQSEQRAVEDEGGSDEVRIIFLYHSTGQVIWDGGVAEWLASYNDKQGTNYQITAQDFPQDSPYGWENYPYDYWNIWVNQGDQDYYLAEPTLETLTQQYDVIIWKHCFPVSDIGADIGQPDVTSSDKRLENYKLQYLALKDKMLGFPNNKFIVWTIAAQTQNNTEAGYARRAQEFVNWVRNDWDEPGDNIFIWDFYQLETEGGLYLKKEYAEDPSDSHPNAAFSQRVAPLLGQRSIEVILGQGDNSNITGE